MVTSILALIFSLFGAVLLIVGGEESEVKETGADRRKVRQQEKKAEKKMFLGIGCLITAFLICLISVLLKRQGIVI